MGVFRAAQNNWPEDEAYETLCWIYECELDDCEASKDRLKEVEARLFVGQPDREELLSRYRARIRKGLSDADKAAIRARYE